MPTRRIRTYHEVEGAGDAVVAQVVAQQERLAARLAKIGSVVVVGSGKGGVGKSAVAANLAAALAWRGRRVGAVDADLNGPTLGRMLGAEPRPPRIGADGVEPAAGAAGVAVMSMDLLLDEDDAVLRWKRPGAESAAELDGPPEALWQSLLEAGAVREFIADTAWGERDDLVIDAPPGTDKLVRLIQLLPKLDAVVLVTTPSAAARFVVAKSARLLAGTGVRTGLVANMTAHVCEACGHRAPLFADAAANGAGTDRGVAELAVATGLSVWADIPYDGRLALSTDAGRPYVLERPDSPASRAIFALADRLFGEEHAAGADGERDRKSTVAPVVPADASVAAGGEAP